MLQVQLPERVVVYEQGDPEGMLYRVKEKLVQKSECSLLVATSESLLLCQVDIYLYNIITFSPQNELQHCILMIYNFNYFATLLATWSVVRTRI